VETKRAMERANDAYKVSEELSSVETQYFLYLFSTPVPLFQKNLVVWKQDKIEELYAVKCRFQKNLVVWKLPDYYFKRF